MRLNQLDAITMGRLLAKLCAAHGKPFGTAAELQVEVYHDALQDCTTDEVEAAVSFACRELERFPKPKTLRGIILSRRPQRASRHDDADLCRFCRTGYAWRRLPHWVPGAVDRLCDCGWRAKVQGYATFEDLEQLAPDDPIAAAEFRRRAVNPGSAA